MQTQQAVSIEGTTLNFSRGRADLKVDRHSHLRAGLLVASLVLVAASLLEAVAALASYPGFFLQPAAWGFVLRFGCAYVAYGVLIAVLAARAYHLAGILRLAAIWGTAAAALEIANISIEHGWPFAAHGPALQIAFMLASFLLWGCAGGHAGHRTGLVRAGVLGGVCSAAFSSLLSVPAGLCIELFASPPAPEYVAQWGEFKRSGWTDAHAFGIANALDSAFTHLLLAPVIAAIFALGGALLATRIRSQIAKNSAAQ
jgi:hypothetical protein